MSTPMLYFVRTICAMMVMPMIFIVIYPLAYLVLPETTARLADLPRDLVIFLLIEVVCVPLFALWLYYRVQHKLTEKVIREANDTRDVM